MAFKFGGSKPLIPAPAKATTILPDSLATEKLVETHVRMNEANEAVVDAVLEAPRGAESIDAGDERVTGAAKLSRLVDDNFPFDESQLAAIEGIANQRYACLTGAAGTGKTTSTKAIVDRIRDSLGLVDMKNYFKRADPDAEPEVDDDYEIPKEAIPSICLVGFTGRSSQMIKKNFPRDWHGNIMTIHRMLAFVPEFYEDYDHETGGMRNKMRFTPTYNKFLKLPWDVIVIDEAGMVSIDLWEQVWAACKPGCRIIMIGDINQLPPVHGRSVFGFAMTKWPSWELTHIHRQVGVNNSIVDNAWKILKGMRPESDNYQSDPGWKFAMMPIPEDSALASRKIRKWLEAMNGKAYQPHRDSVITAINAEEGGNGYALGQIPMNRELAIVFNKESPRYIIDAGRERKQFAVGDKVMATRNDHEAGITNGMTGIVTDIKRNGAYAGDIMRFGIASEVNAYLADELDGEDDDEFSLEDIAESHAAVAQGMANAKEKKERGPASHIVTVKFGDGEHSFDIQFATLAEVASLMVAYVVTCHKMQGGESPLVVVICHQSHKAMLNREWLYTAVTRASAKCVLFFTDMGLRAALSKQRIKGTTLAQKVKVFQELQTKGLVGAAVDIDLPVSESFGRAVTVAPSTMLEQAVEAEAKPSDAGKNALLERLAAAKARQHAAKEPSPSVHVYVDKVVVHNHFHAAPTPAIRRPAHVRDDFESRVAADLAMMTRTGPAKQIGEVVGTRAVVPVGKPRTVTQAKRPEPLRLTYQPHVATERSPRVEYGTEMQEAARMAAEAIVNLESSNAAQASSKPAVSAATPSVAAKPAGFRFGKKG